MRYVAQLIYFVASIMVVARLDGLPYFDNTFVRWFIVLPVVTFIVILVHEAGHAVAVKALRGRVLQIRVTFFQFDLTRRRFVRATKFGDHDVGGFVLYDFVGRGITSDRAITVAAAGPLANYMFAGVLLGMAFLLSSDALAAPSPIAAPVAIEVIDGASFGELTNLPSDDVISRMTINAPAVDWAEIATRLMVAIAALSAGIAIADLLPFEGGDGQQVLRHTGLKLKARRSQWRNRRKRRNEN